MKQTITTMRDQAAGRPVVLKILAAGVAVLTLSAILPLVAGEPSEKPAGLKPLELKLPDPTLKGTPEDLPAGPTIDPLPKEPRPAFLVPEGVKNVALGKTVTSSVKPFTGELSQVVDGKKDAFDYDAIEMKKGTQWVQIDLGAEYTIHAIVMWHDHRYIQIARDVIVQVADDAEFTRNVRSLFNNDVDNSAGLGVGTDREYFETHQGKLIDTKGIKARYLRGYSRGTNLTGLNCWQEIEVYGLPN